MRVLHFLSSSSFHGAETMAAELVRQLHALGVETDVAVLDNGGRGDRQILQVAASAIAEGVVLPCAGRYDRRTAPALRAHLARRRIDVVHSHKYKSSFYTLLALRGLAPRPPLVATFHNWLYDTWKLRAYAWLDQRLARHCDAAVAVSAPIERTLLRHAARERVWRIGNGVDVQRYRPFDAAAVTARRAAQGWGAAPVLGFVGRLVPDKGLRFLMQALALLDREGCRDWQFVLLGEGPDRAAIEAQAQSLGLQDRVRLLGNRSDVAELLPALDLFVLPSLVEAFPMVVVEAMACGLPVLATDVGDVARIVETPATGRVVAPRDAVALAAALRELLALPDGRRRAMGEAGRARAEEQFSSRRMAQAYLDVYERVLRG
jgi:glycosyltransferase involved in cell wall biosynthesis